MTERTTKTMLENAAREIVDTIVRKNRDYGDAYAQLGLQGTFLPIHGKYWRLRRLMWERKCEDVSAVRESVLDMGAFAVLALVLVDHPEITQPRDAQRYLELDQDLLLRALDQYKSEIVQVIEKALGEESTRVLAKALEKESDDENAGGS